MIRQTALLILSVLLCCAAAGAAPADLAPNLAGLIAPALPMELHECSDEETARGRSIAYQIWCGRSDAKLKEMKNSWAAFLESEPTLEARIGPAWDKPVAGLYRFRFWAGDRGVILTFAPRKDEVRIMLRDPIPWCRDLTPLRSSAIRKEAMHSVPGLEFPVKSRGSLPTWPAGESRVNRHILSVTADMIIDREGVPADVCIVDAEPDLRGSRESAVDSILRWRYSPGVYKGEKVPVAVTVKVKFDSQIKTSSGPFRN